ncbi:peptidoglycan DD-metalloendopeptidase family protein [Shewanella pneumatophori]|uniref:Peptidoglycan DD-metalloendopeptidase family protein n=1 Tax=Shewanella pneumatophori TaxID=314092 RepID=A0A9X2CDI2_9GAMM|nr:peptidoglycan DD-metalloendopeptidase family protein [Shewanella pneumatophori]MCL1139188.1 peptidoglycan DD-metalloendopeptidase family protein [Shewanella pneumatophori]
MSRNRLAALPPIHRKLLLGSVLVIGTALLLPKHSELLPQRIPVQLDIESILEKSATIPSAEVLEPVADFQKQIVKGDTLSGLFEQGGVDQQTMYRVLEADLNVLALDTLMPGNNIQFWLNDAGELEKLSLYFNAARQVIFSRFDDGSFNVEEVNIEGIWRDRAISGQIHGSFYVSAQKMGLNAGEIQRVESLLKEKLNFARDLRAGDKFSVLMNDQFIDGEATGNSHVLGVTIERGSSSINAYQHTDGNFYDEKGESLARAFQRIPLMKNYRISSRFNRHRHHPVTGRTSPHNGTDFATPIGTKIVAPGDGIVSLVTDHRYAGKYVVIEHGNKYRTRYLHLSKSLVHKGQRVSRGQVIALSGNTGRITGPHLHYEFHINGRPVDPMKAKIPMASKLSSKEMTEFSHIVKIRKMMMGIA